jgi:hypothetical protein
MGTLEQTEQAGAPNAGKNKRSVKGLLINRRFQLKYTLIVVFLAVVISTVLGVLLYHRVSENTTLTLDNLRALAAPAEFLEQSGRALRDRDREVMLLLVASLLGLVLAITVLGIYVTHKVAGPLYVMSRYLRDIEAGSLREVRALRKGDDLVEFYEIFQQMLAALQDREKRDIAALEGAIRTLRDHLEKLGSGSQADLVAELSQTVESLAALKKRKQEALG